MSVRCYSLSACHWDQLSTARSDSVWTYWSNIHWMQLTAAIKSVEKQRSSTCQCQCYEQVGKCPAWVLLLGCDIATQGTGCVAPSLQMPGKNKTLTSAYKQKASILQWIRSMCIVVQYNVRKAERESFGERQLERYLNFDMAIYILWTCSYLAWLFQQIPEMHLAFNLQFQRTHAWVFSLKCTSNSSPSGWGLFISDTTAILWGLCLFMIGIIDHAHLG